MDNMTCLRRMDDFGPWEHRENLDRWIIEPNGDRTCSFCGSMSADDFEKCIDLCLKDVTLCRIESCDKPYKYYIHRPEIHNATQGAIKFFTHHLKIIDNGEIDQEWLDRINPKLVKAIKISWKEFSEGPQPTVGLEAGFGSGDEEDIL